VNLENEVSELLKKSERVTICGVDHYSINISTTLINLESTYSPINFTISSQLNNIKWGIYDFYLMKVNCPVKCVGCTATRCSNCDFNSGYKNGSCICLNNLFDYGNPSERINCQEMFQPLINEYYNEYYLNSSWIYNTYNIKPNDFLMICRSEFLFGQPGIYSSMDSLTKLISLKDKLGIPLVTFSSYKIILKLIFYNTNNLEKKILSSIDNTLSPLYVNSTNLTVCNQNFSYYSGLIEITKPYTNKDYINSTLIINEKTDMALGFYKLLISPCYKSCLTCTNPTYNGCLSCKDNYSNIVNGECICKSGWEEDKTQPIFICVGI
jgi:hypothetical protein